jgi:hypothetical protein
MSSSLATTQPASSTRVSIDARSSISAYLAVFRRQREELRATALFWSPEQRTCRGPVTRTVRPMCARCDLNDTYYVMGFDLEQHGRDHADLFLTRNLALIRKYCISPCTTITCHFKTYNFAFDGQKSLEDLQHGCLLE